MSAPFLMWYDDNPKLPIARKIEDAIGAYRHRWPSSAPTLVLVNEAEVTEFAGVEVRGVTTVHRNTVWVGIDREPLDHERHERVAKDANAKDANAKDANAKDANAKGANAKGANAKGANAKGAEIAAPKPRRRKGGP